MGYLYLLNTRVHIKEILACRWLCVRESVVKSVIGENWFAEDTLSARARFFNALSCATNSIHFL